MAAVSGDVAKDDRDDRRGIVAPRRIDKSRPKQSMPTYLSQLAKNRLSDNVGGVKHISSVLVRALGRARHFALVEELPYQPRLARNRFQVRNSVRPMHLFGRNFDHDY